MLYLPNDGLPTALYNLLTTDLKVRKAKYSVTELISPPRILHLKRRHDSDIVLDPYSRIWLLFGKLVHGKLEDHVTINALAEESMMTDVNGIRVSGQLDHYENEIIYDFKTTSIYSVREVKDEWERQMNIYASMMRAMGFPVKGLKIVCICKDWSKQKAKHDPQYPQRPIVMLNVQVWSEVDVRKYMADRVTLHESCEAMIDNDLPECTKEEKWCRPAKWAVMVKGKKRAVKLYDTKFEAEVGMGDLKGAYLEERKGEAIRCADYCEVNKFCKYYKSDVDIE